MLIVCRTKAPRRELTVTGSQYHRVRRVEMPVKMGCSRRSASPWLVLPGMRSAVETESAVKKCSLAVMGEVSALALRNQVDFRVHYSGRDEAQAVEAIRHHLEAFWARPMKQSLIACQGNDSTELARMLHRVSQKSPDARLGGDKRDLRWSLAAF
ncbi:formate dehydrogenase subunit delta [Halomonas sp. H10-9-1]|uniref:formate dehydrogenase subunit delta n=1 Tax=Halomonas sp. H10-9-1 TaxID=2950871 RepID=UPI0032DE436B